MCNKLYLSACLTTILLFSASKHACAQMPTAGELSGEVTAYLLNTPILLEPSVQSPVVTVVNSKTKLTLQGYAIDETATKCSQKESVLIENLYFRVKYGEALGYVPRYYVQTDTELSKILSKITGKPVVQTPEETKAAKDDKMKNKKPK
jgi:hypothetical protein